MNSTPVLAIAGLSLTLAFGAAHAGVVITDKDGSTVSISGGVLREADAEAAEVSVYDPALGTVLLMNTEERTFSEGSVEQLCSDLAAAMKKVQEDMTDEEKAMMDRFVAEGSSRGSPDVVVTRLGDGGLVAGLATTRYRVLVEGEPYQELWLTNDISIMGELKAYDRLLALIGRLGECTMSAMTGGQGTVQAPESTTAYRQMLGSGYPLRILSFEDGESVESVAARFEKRDLQPSVFSAPNGFARKSFGEMLLRDR